VTISFLPRSRKRGRHQFDPDTAVTVADDLRQVPDGPQPDPLRDTGEIPVLADAQRALLEQQAVPVPDRPGQGTLQPRPPRISPLPPGTPRAPRLDPATYALRVQALMYPPCDGGDYAAHYAELMRRVSRLTGTRSPLEDAAAWTASVTWRAAA
jgi:hypothetical protein